MAAADDRELVEEEARLARAAAAGDGSAFATLYERYERRAYNLAYRIGGSEEDAADAVQEAFLSVMRRLPRLGDRELEFGPYVFATTRNACLDLMRKRRRTQPSDSIPEAAAPVGSGAGGLGLDPGDPEEDPDRMVLLSSQQDEVREASMRLPERQREALALRELEELSYDEIAAVMEMNRNSVAQLISRARIKLRDELRGTALASIASASPECERALPLIAMRDDGQLGEEGEDAAWLDAHMAGCETCRLGLAAMQEAGASYRAWTPLAAPGLLEETMAEAASLAGADWSEEIATALKGGVAGPLRGMPAAYGGDRGGARHARRRRIAAASAGLAAVLLLAGLGAILARDEPPDLPAPPAAPAADRAPTPGAEPPGPGKTGTAGAGPAGPEGQELGASAAPPPAPVAPAQGAPPPDSAAQPAPRPEPSGAVEPPRSVDPANPRPRPKPPPEPAPVTPPPAEPEPPPAVLEPEPTDPPREGASPTGDPVTRGPS